MGYTIPDEILKQAGISEQEVRIELACRLFDAGKLSLFQARQVAGLAERWEMEEELGKRNIAVYRPTVEDLENDLKNLDRILGPVNHANRGQ